MIRIEIVFLMLTVLLFGVHTVGAETVTWNNSAGGFWNSSTDWLPPKIPVLGDDVIINGTGAVSLNSSTTIKTLKLKSARLVVAAGTLSLSSTAPSTAPTSAFTSSIATPFVKQAIQFIDSSSTWPTYWSWNFGDGTSSQLQHPVHIYSTPGSYTVTLVSGNANGYTSVSQSVTVINATPGAIGSFSGSIVLGSPTATSIKANIYSSDQNGTVYLQYGTSSGVYDMQSSTGILAAGTPLVLSLSKLLENRRYYYRLYYYSSDGTGSGPTEEHTFHTARPTGSSFSFTIQADSHLDENSDPAIYSKTLNNVLSDVPDFHIDLGDTFMCEKHSAPLTALTRTAPDQATVISRYRYERDYFNLISHSTPLFLVNGNHEGEAGWLNDATADNIAVWTTKARLQYYLNPIPDGFYTGDTQDEPSVGKRASWYSWNWGDALFIVLDPFWNSTDSGSRNPWSLSLGERQYAWLKETLSASTAPFKFVFVHNLVGGLDGQMRGGIEAAPYFEWGGKNLDGTDGYTQNRPGWSMTIHQLLTTYGVTALFHGHDHIYAKQDLDGVVYQEVPQPSAVNSQSAPELATQYHYAAGTILSSSGHIRVTVEPERITSQYVRTWLPVAENSQQKNAQEADVWSVGTAGMPTASFKVATIAPLEGQAVVFADTSTGDPISWFWQFGDDATSTLQNPGHIYSKAGTYIVSLTIRNLSGAHTTTKTVVINQNIAVLTASFTFSPTVPVAGQPTTFADTSSGSPTSWSWDFGDGVKSKLQNPSHTYAAAGTYIVNLKAAHPLAISSMKKTVTVVQAGTASTFGGNIVLGSPTSSSIKANIFTPDQSGMAYLAYGTTPGNYGTLTESAALQAASPLEYSLNYLQADTRYYYRLYFKVNGATEYAATDEYSFHTARSPGSTFTFAIQGDSHPEREGNQFNQDLYRKTLLTAAADNPDFYLTIGDDFSVDTLDPLTITKAQVIERYRIQRPYLGLIGRNVPVFLVNGNHEQAARYLLNGTADNVAVWAQNARNSYFPQPAPDGFYTGNIEAVPFIGLLRNHFAWNWGDALFVVIDPYWGSPVCVDNPFGDSSKASSLWETTHGNAQYQWLKTTLENSTAKYKFVFAHHVMGTGRGGIELADLYEWGGLGNKNTWEFSLNRPGWTSPIHQLMAANGVTIFFQGHDHIWVKQQLDGVVYQTLPEPADPFYTLYNSDAFLSGDKFPNTGYTRVTVSPSAVKVDYVRTWLPVDEGPGKVSGGTVFSYSIP